MLLTLMICLISETLEESVNGLKTVALPPEVLLARKAAGTKTLNLKGFFRCSQHYVSNQRPFNCGERSGPPLKTKEEDQERRKEIEEATASLTWWHFHTPRHRHVSKPQTVARWLNWR